MEQFLDYIKESIEKANKEEQSLIAQDRKDEANLMKIRANIYGICQTIYEVVSKTNSGEALKEEYLKKLTVIPQNWKASYDKAKEHNDVEKILIEEIKLDLIEEVKKKFQEY